ncbi:MAG: glycosyltransferase family 39 protein [Planctomycetes bacterium]|nr:glycosyltransferase family 39 protein [Planctomycetota bacterium]
MNFGPNQAPGLALSNCVNIKASTNRPMKPIRPAFGLLIFVAALALRAAWVSYRWYQAGAALEYPDEELHWQLATNLVRDGVLVTDDGRYAARMPLYPLFLATFAWLGTNGVLLARLAQAVLGAAAAWVASRFGRAALGPAAGVVAGLLVCCDPFAIFFAGLLLTEVPFTLIGLGFAYCTWRCVVEPPAVTRFQVAGVALLGTAALMTRPAAAGWLALVWLTIWLWDRNRGRATRRCALFVAALALALLPWGARNRAVLGSFAWLSTNGGVTLYDGQGPQAQGDSDQSFLQGNPALNELGEVELDRTLRRRAFEQMRANPTRAAQLAWIKFRRTWSLAPHVAAYRSGPVAWISAAFTATILIAAAAGLLRTRRRHRLRVVIWLPVVYFTLVHCVFVGSLRYRVPLMPFVAIAATAVLPRAATSGRGSLESELTPT